MQAGRSVSVVKVGGTAIAALVPGDRVSGRRCGAVVAVVVSGERRQWWGQRAASAAACARRRLSHSGARTPHAVLARATRRYTPRTLRLAPRYTHALVSGARIQYYPSQHPMLRSSE
ncbi:hypothetical protein RR46_03759 [Papilio xuthus]|uniref:Uncharacterized protein n=1 Tax=Papilio xuthus TaxID=66420 RepID=A0A194Q315_PAPXU|nr:hypothetical protein RR46_03759 [Papilio xuthus]